MKRASTGYRSRLKEEGGPQGAAVDVDRRSNLLLLLVARRSEDLVGLIGRQLALIRTDTVFDVPFDKFDHRCDGDAGVFCDATDMLAHILLRQNTHLGDVGRQAGDFFHRLDTELLNFCLFFRAERVHRDSHFSHSHSIVLQASTDYTLLRHNIQVTPSVVPPRGSRTPWIACPVLALMSY